MKKTLSILSLLMFTVFGIIISQASSNSDTKNKLSKTGLSEKDNPVFALSIGTNIRTVFQDKNGNMWIGTEGNGAYKIVGNTYMHYTSANGLKGDYVWTINQDENGNMWFGTNEGIMSFNGIFFIDYTKNEKASYKSSSCSFVNSKGLIQFGTKGGIFTFNGEKLVYTALPTQESDIKKQLTDYSVYSIFENEDGSFYYGTEFKGVCKFDGKKYTYLKDDGLSKGAIRSIFKDKNGLIWFGSNGTGIFNYDGKTVRNISEENHLLNQEAIQKKNPIGNLTRVWTINSDLAGNIWIGTIDNGAWRYDGNKFVNFRISDGLQNNGVQNIYKDNTGKLWFAMNSGGLSTFDGVEFKVIIKGNPERC